MTIYLGTNLLAGSFKSGASWEVGDIGQSALGIDESLNKRRYLNGQVISQTQFAQFTAWLKQRVSLYPSLATSEADWQTAVTNSDLGQCGQFVIDDVNSTIRLPKVVNLQGLMDLTHLGETVEAGLPNINLRSTGIGDNNTMWHRLDGYSVNGVARGDNTSNSLIEPFASVSNPIYGNSSTVQPESIQYPYFIQVAEGIENSVDVSREIELSNPFSLLDYKFSEYEITNASWLRSNGQYNSGTTYVDVYNLLLQIYNGTVTKAGVSVKLSTETYADTDFVLNTTDTTFRLPLKVALASGKAVAGNGMTLGLTNGTQQGGLVRLVSAGQAWANMTSDSYGQDVGLPSGANTMTSALSYGITTDPTKSGIETSANGLYLYFYVGAVIQDASVIAAASVLTDVANLKAHYIVETYVNGTSWYRVYSDGWCEQGGSVTKGSSLSPNERWNIIIELLKTYINTNYKVFLSYSYGTYVESSGIGGFEYHTDSISTNSFRALLYNRNAGTAMPSELLCQWQACGYIS